MLNMMPALLLVVFTNKVMASHGGIRPLNYTIDDWTSCEEFLNGTIFDPYKVIDVDWKIFYFWNYDSEPSYHIKFSIPTPGLIDRFKQELDDELVPPVNWTNAELFMETSVELSGLLIKNETSGEFRLIPSLSFELTATPKLSFGLKLVNGVLGFMNCRYRICYALAPIENVPEASQIQETASTLGFKNPFGHSYLLKMSDGHPPPPLQELDDADDDEQLNIDRDMSLRII